MSTHYYGNHRRGSLEVVRFKVMASLAKRQSHRYGQRRTGTTPPYYGTGITVLRPSS